MIKMPALAAITVLALTTTQVQAQVVAATPVSLTAGLADSTAGYRIGADDRLEVAVFQAPDLSREVRVDAAGRILLPLIGPVDVMGLTPQEMSDKVALELGKKYMRDPQVSVLVKESASQRVTIDGAVVQPGIYPMSGPTTLLQAVALAKGADPRRANTRKVSVFRLDNTGARVGTTYDLAAIRLGKAADPEIYPKDVVVVAGSAGAVLMDNMAGVLPIVSLLRPW